MASRSHPSSEIQVYGNDDLTQTCSTCKSTFVLMAVTTVNRQRIKLYYWCRTCDQLRK